MGKKLGKSVAWDFLLNAKMREKVSRALKRTRGGGEGERVEKRLCYFLRIRIFLRGPALLWKDKREREGGVYVGARKGDSITTSLTQFSFGKLPVSYKEERERGREEKKSTTNIKKVRIILSN